MYENNDYRNYLAHHGILGMHWGKRQGPPYPLGSGDHSVSEKKAGWRKSLGGGRNEEEYGRKSRSKKTNSRAVSDGNKASTKSVGKKVDKLKTEKSGNENVKKALKVAVAVGITAVAAYGVYKGAKYINAKNVNVGKKALGDVLEDTAEFTFADGSSLKTVSKGSKLVNVNKSSSGIASNAGDAYEKLVYGNNSPYGKVEFVDGSKNLLAKDPSKVKLTTHEMPSHIKGPGSVSNGAAKPLEATKKVESLSKNPGNLTSNRKVLDLNSEEGMSHQKRLGITPSTPSKESKITLTLTTEGNSDYNAQIKKNADAFAKKASQLTSQTSKVDSGEDYVNKMLKKSAESARKAGVKESEIIKKRGRSS